MLEDNGRRLSQLIAKMDKFDGYFNKIITTLDGLAMNARLDRVEVDVDKNKRDIKEIKTKLAMP